MSRSATVSHLGCKREIPKRFVILRVGSVSWRRIRNVSLTVFLSFLLSITIAEILLRLLVPVHLPFPEDAYRYDPEMGFRLQPAIHLLSTTDHQQEILVNSLGTSNFQKDFQGYKSLVFALGDSYTEGSGLPADASYPFQLDLLLNRDDRGMYSKKYGVVNLGTSGFGGKQSLIALRHWALALHPPEIIVYFGCDNDYEDDLVFQSGLRHRHLVSGNPHYGWMARPMRWLAYDLQIGIRTKMFLTTRAKAKIVRAAGPLSNQSVAELEKPELEKLLTFAKQHDSVLVLGWANVGPSYDWLKSWSETNGIRFADWASRVQSVQAAVPDLPLENQHSGGHYRAWVNQIIAKEYAHQILTR